MVPVLPFASTQSISRDFGTIALQEIKTNQFLLRYFVFYFFKQMPLIVKETGEGLQSLLTLKGAFHYGVKGQRMYPISEGQFTLLNAGRAETETIVPAGKECHLVNTYYSHGSYKELLPYFPGLKADLKRTGSRPLFFLSFPRSARHSVLDSVNEILYEPYSAGLIRKHWELKLKHALFTQLAQTYTERTGRKSNPLEKEIALTIQNIILEDISKHYSLEELAGKVGFSISTLKRAFRQEFGTGIYEYLFILRMQKAKELLLKGEQVKNVAPAVGMRPSNFTMQFQKYFGYKATSLRKSK
jgi:AraC-like DNA-binding protein